MACDSRRFGWLLVLKTGGWYGENLLSLFLVALFCFSVPLGRRLYSTSHLCETVHYVGMSVGIDGRSCLFRAFRFRTRRRSWLIVIEAKPGLVPETYIDLLPRRWQSATSWILWSILRRVLLLKTRTWYLWSFFDTQMSDHRVLEVKAPFTTTTRTSFSWKNTMSVL